LAVTSQAPLLAPAPRREAAQAWVAAGLWLALIAVESTGQLSAQHTSSWLGMLFHSIFGPVPRATILFWNHILRKTGHVFGYGMLSFLLFRAWRTTLHPAPLLAWTFPWARAAFLATVLVATLDEWHQTTIPSRTGSFDDALLDTSAAVAVQLWLWYRLRNQMRSAK
jgi:VanZ family protein